LKVRADRLDVGDEMLRCVGGERQVGMAAAGTALIGGSVEVRGIKQPPVGAGAARPMQEQRRTPRPLPHVQPMAVTDGQHARIVRAQRLSSWCQVFVVDSQGLQ
jgi:hypothetical protein